jgi:peroxiredoxin
MRQVPAFLHTLNRALALLLVLFACSTPREQDRRIRISGALRFPAPGHVVLERLTDGGYVPADTFRLDGQRFELEVVLAEPGMYRINFFGRQQNFLILDRDDLYIEADGNTRSGAFAARGSQEMDDLQRAEALGFSFQLRRNDLKSRYQRAIRHGHADSLNYLTKAFEELGSQEEEVFRKLIVDMGGRLSALKVALDHLPMERHADFYRELFQRLENGPSGGFPLDRYRQRLDSLSRLVPGVKAPELALPDSTGALLPVSAFRGSVLLLDFWAAWCQPCRVENPDLVRIYRRFHDQGFEILGISLDKTRTDWLQAVARDGLLWPQVSDLKYMQSEAVRVYDIRTVPTNYLLNREGIILAKNLRPAQLEAYLDRLFSN